jgi:hypothetical protein
MTPKEKAVELVQRFIDEAYAETAEQLYTPVAKNAALIAVDEVLNEENHFIQTDAHLLYWEQVKQEIKNL